MDARAQSIDQKIKLIDQQLAKSRDQIKKIRPGPSQDAVKKRALIILKQKKMYEHQRDQLYSQQYNVDSVAFATENAKATVDTVRAMKAASKEMKTQFKQKEFDIDKIDSLNDQMAEEKPLGAMPNAPIEKGPEASAHATNAGEVPPQKETAEKV